MEKSIKILEFVDIFLISSSWNGGSVLSLYEDNFEDSTDLVILKEVGFSFRCNRKLLDNQLGSFQKL